MVLLQPLKSRHRPRFKAAHILTLHTPLATIPNLNHTSCLVVTRVPADPPIPPIQDTLALKLLQVSSTKSAKKTTQASLIKRQASLMRKAASLMQRPARLTTPTLPMKQETQSLLSKVQTLKLNRLHPYPSNPLEMKAISCIKRRTQQGI